MGGPELAQRLADEYAGTVRSGKPSYVEALERIRAKAVFKQTKLTGWIKKIGQTPKGAVEIVLVVPFEQRVEALELVVAYGMPLEMYIKLMGEKPPDDWTEEAKEFELELGHMADD